MNTKPALSLSILTEMQFYIYNNIICDNYPLTHKALYNYFKLLISNSFKNNISEIKIVNKKATSS